jgi:Do/DeqQ family serine protease
VADQVRPAVVNIGTIHRSRARKPMTPQPFSDDPFFRDFFNQFFGSEGPGPRGGEFRQPSLGSGVIIDKRGLVLTNFHVIRGADEITVRLSDKREYRGQVMGTDPKTDLAVVRFQPDHELKVARLGNSESLKVGEWAIAIGNPFGLDQTVTVGVISATGRSEVGIATYENFIQTDASINPGNSGGPLVNLKGEVVGINTAIVAAGQGIGFAIPVNMVRRVVDQLVDKGKVVRGWLGIALQPLSPELAQSYGLSGTTGAVVGSTMPAGPAAAAGLQQGDVIVSYDKIPIEDYRHLQRLVADTRVGSTVSLEIVRKKQRMTVSATVGEVPEDRSRRAPAATPGG